VKFEQPKDARTICTCPICGKGNVISSRHRGDGPSKIVFHCTDAACPMRLGSPLAGRRITEDEVKLLCRDGITPWLEGFISKQGKPFPTKLKIFTDGSKPVVRMTSREDLMLCDCPVCKTGKIVPFLWRQSENTAYEGWQCSEKECSMQRFYNPKYGRLFTEDEVRKLFTEGQIAVPSGMVDRSGNPFAAMVCLETDDDNELTGKIVTKKIKRRT
jgi:ssDNA-binding Zn-finger/Zn-ribbon topoisomerase 1